MNKNYIKYNKETCEILCIFSLPAGEIENQQSTEDEAFMKVADDFNASLYYVEKDMLKKKKEYDLTVEELNNKITIKNIPRSTNIVLAGNEYTINDNELEINYTIKEKIVVYFCNNVKYADKEVIFNED